jgi:prophage antirepressor-like protein
MTMVPSPSTPLVFTFPETAQHVRSVMIDSEPWWLANDLCAVLGIGNVGNALARLDAGDKGSIRIADGTPGNPNKAIVNESGLYDLILDSRKPEARAFRRWITSEVIPSIRRTGAYSAEPAAAALPQDYEEALVALLGQVRETKALTARVAELEPAAQSWQTLAAADGDFSVADAAKILARDPNIKLGRNRLFSLLDELRWTYRQLSDDRPRVMQAAIERQWLSEIPQSHYHPRTGELVMDAPQVRVTAKGLHELHKRLGGTAAVAIPTVPAQGGAS